MNLSEMLQSLLSKYHSYKIENVTNKQIVAKPSLDHLDYNVYLTTEQFDEFIVVVVTIIHLKFLMNLIN